RDVRHLPLCGPCLGRLHLLVEVGPWLSDLQLVHVQHDDGDVDVVGYEHSASSWSQNPGYEMSTHSALSTSVTPLASRPATANATRWSTKEEPGAPSRRRGPWTSQPSSSSIPSAPIAESPAAIAAMRSDSFTRSSLAPLIRVVPGSCTAATARTGSSSISPAT